MSVITLISSRPRTFAIFVVLGVLIVGGGVVLWSMYTPQPADASDVWGSEMGLNALFGAASSTPQERADDDTPSVRVTVADVRAQLDATYTSEAFGFSFKYPSAFRIGSFKETPEQATILLQHPESRVGLQIVVTELEESVELTEGYIREELPSLTVLDPQPVRIDGEQRGVVFLSTSEAFGKSREIWFTHDEHLYQVSSYATLDPFIKAIFSTWEFTQ